MPEASAAAAVVLWMPRWTRRRVVTTTEGTIHRYPVKSCGAEQLDEVRCDRLQPLPGDRAFMWVDAESKFITQRPHEP